jgi:predicted ATPase
MIKAIGLQNVRLFDDSKPMWDFELAPLTIFCGTNSSGKSTILRTLLLLRQSQGIGEGYSPNAGRLRFKGSQVDLGNYKTFVSNNDIAKEIKLSATFNSEIWLTPLIQAIKDSGELSLDDFEDYEFTHDTKLKITWTFEAVATTPVQSRLKETFFQLFYEDKLISWWRFLPFANSEETLYNSKLIMPESLSNFIVETVLAGNDIEVYSRERDVKGQKVAEFDTSIEGLLPKGIAVNREKSQRVLAELPFEFLELFASLQNNLSNLHYIAPLRSPAKRYYVSNLDSPSNEPSGEFLVDILRSKLGVKTYHDFSGEYVYNSLTFRELLIAWLYYLRTGETPEFKNHFEEIELKLSTEEIAEIKIKGADKNSLHSLADSGFGYSQVLPILVRGLLAEKGSTIVIEQPELHLNPAIQVRLAEFFVSLMKVGKQVIIETHSEHIIDMIRVLTAEDTTGKISQNTKIYYIDANGETPEVRDLSIQPDGTIPKWPRDFLGEALNLSGRLLRAQKLHRNKSKENGANNNGATPLVPVADTARPVVSEN